MKKFEPFQKVTEVLGKPHFPAAAAQEVGIPANSWETWDSLQGLRTQMGMDLKWDRHYSHLAVE